MADAKALIAFCREQKVIVFEYAGLRVQFSALAHEPPPLEPAPKKPAAEGEDDPPRFDPGDP